MPINDNALTGYELSNAFLFASRKRREKRDWPSWLRVQYLQVLGEPPPADMSASWMNHSIGAELQYIEFTALHLPLSQEFLARREALQTHDKDNLDSISSSLIEIQENERKGVYDMAKKKSKKAPEEGAPEKAQRMGARQFVLAVLECNNDTRLCDEAIYKKLTTAHPGHGWPWVRVSHMRQLLNREHPGDPISNFDPEGNEVKTRKRGTTPPPNAREAEFAKWSAEQAAGVMSEPSTNDTPSVEVVRPKGKKKKGKSKKH